MGDGSCILTQYDPASFHLSDFIKESRSSNGIDRPSERQKSFSYGSVEQSKDGSTTVFCEVTVTINDKTILKRVSGMAKAGEILAIMGPSGAGKSTLLSVMAGRIPVTSGHVTLNGQAVTKCMRREISYVLQADCFYPILTLREMLTFVAHLQLPDSMPTKLKIRRMLDIVDTLELNKCIDTNMGSGVNFLKGGLSGGERKRANIACQLIANPRLLLIDEPTSGLDSAIAHDLMKSLTKLSTQQRKTIVATIHQPSSEIFNLFSKVLLLVAGEVVYFGSGDKIPDFFAEIGLPFDPLVNPADFIMEKIKADQGKLKEMINLSYVARTQEDWPKELKESMLHLLSGSASKKDFKTTKGNSNDVTEDAKWPTGFWTQYTTLTRRSFIMSKYRFLSRLNLIHVVILFVIGSLWFQLPRSESTMNDRLSLLYFLCVLTEMTTCIACQLLIYDVWGVFETEKSAGVYRLSAYYLGTLTAEAPFELVLGVFYGITSYWVAGLTPDASCFFFFLLILLLGIYTAQSFGILISILVHRREYSITIATTILLLLSITAGFYNAHVPVWLDWLRYVSFMARIWSAIVEIEWLYGQEFQCNPASSTNFPKYCTNGTTFPGSAFLNTHIVADIPLYINIPIVIFTLIVLHVASYLFLRFLKTKPRS